jgi:hypothetical protein
MAKYRQLATLAALAFLLLPLRSATGEEGKEGVWFLPKSRQELMQTYKDLPKFFKGDTFYVVTRFDEGCNADDAGVREGDVLFRRGTTLIKTKDDFEKSRSDNLQAGDEVNYVLKRYKNIGNTAKWENVAISFPAMKKSDWDAAREKEEEEREKVRERLGPLPIVRIGIGRNSINIPFVALTFQNNTDREIVGVKSTIECFDSFGNPVTWPGQGNRHYAIYQQSIAPDAKVTVESTLNLRSNTTKVYCWITSVAFRDGSEWSQTDEEAKKNDRIESISR